MHKFPKTIDNFKKQEFKPVVSGDLPGQYMDTELDSDDDFYSESQLKLAREQLKIALDEAISANEKLKNFEE